MSERTAIHLRESMFSERERLLLEHDDFNAFLFRYDSGVCAVRLTNARGELVMLPFQGQQIWSAKFNGRDLTMKSMFSEPIATRNYLETYGAFLVHCGFTAMGVPSEGDTHPLHGELPNAPYQRAWLELGEDETGTYLALGGQYKHTVAFSYNYVAEPLVKLYANRSLFNVTLKVANLKETPMEYMYLAHVNFRPVNEGRLVYSALCTPEHVRVRLSIPSHVTPKEGYREFLEQLAEHPEEHNIMTPGLPFDPEVVFLIDYLSDNEGWAHSLQVHPDGAADYIRHRPVQAPVGVRWICRTPDQDALSIVSPATAEPEGYSAEKRKGNLKTLVPKGVWGCELMMGALEPQEAAEMAAHVDKVVAGRGN